MIPHVCELAPAPSVDEAARALAGRPGLLLLDGRCPGTPPGREADPPGRYSYLMADPVGVRTWRHQVGRTRTATLDHDVLRGELSDRSRLATPAVAGLPPFQGGWAGLFGYGLLHAFERVRPAARDEFGLPDLHLGLYDVVIAWDHAIGTCHVISQGLPATESSARRRRAVERSLEVRRRLEDGAGSGPGEGGEGADVGSGDGPAAPTGHSVVPDRVAVEPPWPDVEGPVYSNFTREGFLAAVRRGVAAIRAGDLFQVNLAQRLLVPWAGGTDVRAAMDLHRRLATTSEAPFSAVYDLGDAVLVSASPERLVRLTEAGDLEARPIKGTRPLTGDGATDDALAAELTASEKDRAENVMIVDLLRNDLARVAVPESVRVASLCHLERHRYVQHLVSVVTGRRAGGVTPWDVIAAVFPGGSVTGAPKIRAMELIHEIEPSARGAYCGSLGYVGLSGAMDLSILIRTVTLAGGWAMVPVGGGITAISDPEQEYAETWTKAAGILRAGRPGPGQSRRV